MIENKVLFITSRNVINTCGELRLIKNRTIALHDEWNIKTDFIAYSNKQRDKKDKEGIGANSSMIVCQYSKYNLADIIRTYISVRKIAKKQLKENKYSAIVLSGMLVLSLAKYFKNHYPKIEIIADIHGASDELVEFKHKSSIKTTLNNLAYKVAMFEQKRSLPYCDSAFVVSEALRKYVLERFKTNHLNFYIVPCSISRVEIDITNSLALRNKWREELNINTDELLFIYSGGTSAWQSIDDANIVFQMIKERMPKQKVHFLIMSHDSRKLQYLASNIVSIRSFKPHEVKDVLFAGDFAFLLRGDYITNNVAFPNKFIEYVMSGMQIISTPFVHDVADYINNYKLGIIIESINESEINKIINNIANLSTAQIKWTGRLALANCLCFENTLNSFVKHLKTENE